VNQRRLKRLNNKNNGEYQEEVLRGRGQKMDFTNRVKKTTENHNQKRNPENRRGQFALRKIQEGEVRKQKKTAPSKESRNQTRAAVGPWEKKQNKGNGEEKKFCLRGV